MKRAPRIIFRFAAVGFVVGLVLTALAYAPRADDFQSLYLVLFPPSLSYMALEHASVTSVIIVAAVACCFNALYYAIIGGLYLLFSKLLRRGARVNDTSSTPR